MGRVRHGGSKAGVGVGIAMGSVGGDDVGTDLEVELDEDDGARGLGSASFMVVWA